MLKRLRIPAVYCKYVDLTKGTQSSVKLDSPQVSTEL